MNELNGRDFDIVVFDEMADVTSEMQDLLDKITANQNLFRTSALHPACIYCKANIARHQEYSIQYSDGHPFFKDNLEYLEWLDKKRNG